MRILDLFCGAGGAAMGLHQSLEEAGIPHEITGVDNKPQPNYPFSFKQQDATKTNLYDYDFIWASIPCQSYGFASAKHRNKGKKYPEYYRSIQNRLKESGKPFVIENIVGSPLKKDLKLEGTIFGLGVIRRRIFECNFPIKQPILPKRPRIDGINYFTVAGHQKGTLTEWGGAMGIDWMIKTELSQAVPPAYSKYIMDEFLRGGREN